MITFEAKSHAYIVCDYCWGHGAAVRVNQFYLHPLGWVVYQDAQGSSRHVCPTCAGLKRHTQRPIVGFEEFSDV